MAEQTSSIQAATQQDSSNPTATPITEVVEPQEKSIASKVQEFFEKENFKTNYRQIQAYIVDSASLSFSIHYLYKEFKAQEQGIDLASFVEQLRSSELNDKIILNEASELVGPNWKKLRNIIYITNIKGETNDKEEIEKKIAEAIGNSSVVYKIEINETIKLTVQTPNKEEEDAKFIFGKLFLKSIVLSEKNITLNCAIEEEQFASNTTNTSSSHNNNLSHQYKPTNNPFTNQFTNVQPQLYPQGLINPQQQIQQYQQFNQQQFLQQQQQQYQQLTPQQQQQQLLIYQNHLMNFLEAQNQLQNQQKKYIKNKNYYRQQQPYNQDYNNNKGPQFNQAPRTVGNNLQQPATSGTVHNNNSSRRHRTNNNNNSNYSPNQGFKNNRPNKEYPSQGQSAGFNNKRSNKVFNQNDTDFPNLQLQ